MNKSLKYILIVLNLIMLGLSIKWYSEKNETEPIITGVGQFAALLVLFLERRLSKIITTDIFKSSLKIKAKNSDVTTKRIENSDIEIDGN